MPSPETSRPVRCFRYHLRITGGGSFDFADYLIPFAVVIAVCFVVLVGIMVSTVPAVSAVCVASRCVSRDGMCRLDPTGDLEQYDASEQISLSHDGRVEVSLPVRRRLES